MINKLWIPVAVVGSVHNKDFYKSKIRKVLFTGKMYLMGEQNVFIFGGTFWEGFYPEPIVFNRKP